MELREPPAEEEESPDWTDFIQKIELAIRWEQLPDPDGEMRAHLRPGDVPIFDVYFPSQAGVDQTPVVVTMS